MHLLHISQITEKLHTAGEFSTMLMAMHDADFQIQMRVVLPSVHVYNNLIKWSNPLPVYWCCNQARMTQGLARTPREG